MQPAFVLGMSYPSVHFYRIGTTSRSRYTHNRITEMTAHHGHYPTWPHWIKADTTDNPSLRYLLEFSAIGFKIAEDLHDVLKREQNHTIPVAVIQVAESAILIESVATKESNDRCYPPGVERRVYRKRQTFSSVYNGMVHPFIRHTAIGIIMYLGNLFGSIETCNYFFSFSGETNSRNLFSHYSCMMQSLVAGYRAEWRNGNLPLHFGVLGMPPVQ